MAKKSGITSTGRPETDFEFRSSLLGPWRAFQDELFFILHILATLFVVITFIFFGVLGVWREFLPFCR